MKRVEEREVNLEYVGMESRAGVAVDKMMKRSLWMVRYIREHMSGGGVEGANSLINIYFSQKNAIPKKTEKLASAFSSREWDWQIK